MRIEGNGAAGGVFPMGGAQQTDAQSKQIQNQIENARKELQQLSQNKDLPMEEKLKKKQELNTRISDLQSQLRAHQQELRVREQQEREAKTGRAAENRSRTRQDEAATVGISREGMRALIAAGTSMKQADVQGSVVTSMEGRAGVLESEIAMDAARGSSVEKKKEELADIKQKAADATAAQMGSLGDALEAVRQAKNEENEPKAQPKSEENGPKAQAKSGADESEMQVENEENGPKAQAKSNADESEMQVENGENEPEAQSKSDADEAEIRAESGENPGA